MSNPIAGLGPADYLAAAQRLLPRGPAWSRDPAAILTQMLNALVQTFARVHAAWSNITEVESDPRQAVMLLPDWEASFGLPDGCTPASPSIAQRQAALTARIAAQGGQSVPYFTGVAQSLGYAGATITEFTPWRFGVSHFGDPLYDANWGASWQVNVPAGSPPTAQLSCVLGRIKPSHTRLLIFTES